MDPNTYVNHFVDFASRDNANHVWFTMVTNQGAGGPEPHQSDAIVSYALGDLTLAGGKRLSGRAKQYFSDRRTPGSYVVAPFDENNTDDLGVDIALDGDGVAITLTAHSWGGVRQTLIDVHAHDGVLVASGGSMGNQTPSASYVISLGQVVAPQ